MDAGSDRFLTTLHSTEGGWRWDPGCMVPCDERARDAAAFLTALWNMALDHVWSEPEQFLLIDNHQTLHGRGDASGDEGRELTRLAYVEGSGGLVP